MQKAVLLFIALVSMAMGGKRPEIPDPSLPDPEPYQQQFKTLGASYGATFVAKSVQFSFRSFYFGVIGMCSFNSYSTNRVQFDTSAWKYGSNAFREMLAFHELGHCLLGRGHKNSTHGDGRPESIMRSSMFSERTYLANRDAYLKELFTAEANAIMHQVASRREKPNHNFDDCQWGK